MVTFVILIEVALAVLASLSGLGRSGFAALHGYPEEPRSLVQPSGAVRFAVIGDFGAGGQVRYNSDYGAIVVQASDSALTFEFINRTGVLVDSYTINGPPLATGLASFSAASHAGGLLVSWETVDEANNAGFNLYRADSAAGAQSLLAYMPSQAPGSTQGFTYTYDDLVVRPGQTYWYWLEEVSLTGATTLHGPLSVTMSEPAAVTLASLQSTPAAPAIPAAAMGLAGLVGLVAAVGVAMRRRLQR